MRLCALALLALATAGLVYASGAASEYNARGVEYYNAGRWIEAIHWFEQAYDLAPGNNTLRRNLCNAYQAQADELAKQADFAAAAKYLENAISVDPENHSPLMQLGSYYLRLDMVADAIFRLEEAIELVPEDLDAHELLGDAYYKDNDLPSALAHWEWVLQTAPGRQTLLAKLEKARREESIEQSFQRTDSRHFSLSFPPGTSRRSLSTVLNILERAYMQVGNRFDGTYPPTPIQVIVHNAKGFADVTQMGEHVGALYDGKIRIPLLDLQGNMLAEDELERRLFHEYTHVVVRHLAANNVSWWLNEGLAETFSREFGDTQLHVLLPASEQGALFSLASLHASQLERLDYDNLRLAYAQSHASVNYLWTRYGRQKLRAMMSSLAEGIEPQTALEMHYRLTYEQLEAEVMRSLMRAAR